MSEDETDDQRAKREQWEAHVATSEAAGLCPFSGYTFRRCQVTICDCFREQFPDDPYGLHPEAFIVNPLANRAAPADGEALGGGERCR